MGAAVARAALAGGVLAALLAGPAEAKRQPAKAPAVKRVSLDGARGERAVPVRATLGQVLELQGRHFRPGRGRNHVGFKAAGTPVIYLRAGRATDRTLRVRLTDRLLPVVGATDRTFRLRVRAVRFGRTLTSAKDTAKTVVIGPAARAGGTAAAPAAAGPAAPATVAAPGGGAPAAACDAAVPAGDADADRLPNDLERRIGTDPCAADTDGDGVQDGFEYRSAVDFNDDDYQRPNSALPYPGKRPYANPLDPSDAATDHDGDLLTLAEEQALWRHTTPPAERTFADRFPRATPLSYSDGLQTSTAVRCPDAGTATCGENPARRLARVPDPAFDAFLGWARTAGYATVWVHRVGPFQRPAGEPQPFDIRDSDLDGDVSAREAAALDADGDGFLADGERDADADGLSNFDELHWAMTPDFWARCYAEEPAYTVAFAGTDATDPDSDGDGIRDGADDADRDEYPNRLELSRMRVVGGADLAPGRAYCKPREGLEDDTRLADYGWVQPFNPCLPSAHSPKCSSDWVARYDGPVWWALQ